MACTYVIVIISNMNKLASCSNTYLQKQASCSCAFHLSTPPDPIYTPHNYPIPMFSPWMCLLQATQRLLAGGDQSGSRANMVEVMQDSWPAAGTAA